AALDANVASAPPVTEPVSPKYYAFGWDEATSLKVISNAQVNQGRSTSSPSINTTGSTRPDPHGRQKARSVSELAKSGIRLRYQPEQGIIPYRSDADVEGAQTSDDSRDT
ncbi:hypothetical protein C0992_009429, partial [Termitomyces sp. T32_za158]